MAYQKFSVVFNKIKTSHRWLRLARFFKGTGFYAKG